MKNRNSKAALALLHAMHGHAVDKREIIGAMLVAYTVVLAPAGFGLSNVRGGAQSFFIYDEDDTSRQWHIRNGGQGALAIQNHYQESNATERITLRDPSGVIRWAERQVRSKAKLAVAA